MAGFFKGLAGAAIKQSGLSPGIVDGSLAFLDSLGNREPVEPSVVPTTDTEIKKLSQSQLQKLQKFDSKTPFSCYKDGSRLNVVFEPSGIIAATYTEFKVAGNACDSLNRTASQLDENELNKSIEAFILAWRRNPVWDASQLAAALGLQISLQKIVTQDISKLNIPTADRGQTLLHLAASHNQEVCAQFLLLKGADICRFDVEQKNAFHLAAGSNAKNVIHLFLKNSKAPVALKQANEFGETPVDVAIRCCEANVVVALLNSLPSDASVTLLPLKNRKWNEEAEKVARIVARSVVFKPSDIKGNTLFHMDCEKTLILALGSIPEVAPIVNSINAAGQSPLHVAVARKNLPMMVAMYAIGANLNLPDFDGDTALHHAVKANSCDIVKFLLCVGIDHQLRNNANETAADMAKRIIRETSWLYPPDLLQILDQFSNPAYRNPDAATKPLVMDQLQLKFALEALKTKGKRGIHLLSLDGGGVRGLVIIQILRHIERRMPDFISKIGWIAGTSTGGILALALSQRQPKSLAHCQRLYFQLKDEIFKGKKPYSAQNLEQFLKKEYGEKTSMADLSEKVRVMVTTAKADHNPPTLTLFRNYQLCVKEDVNKAEEYLDPHKVAVWKAARCSSAAPMYFTSVDGCMMDGGLIANNPTCDLITDAERCSLARQVEGLEPFEIASIISIGTGQMPEQPIAEMNVSVPTGFLDGIANLYKNVQAINNLKNILIEQVSAADGQCVKRARAMAHTMKVPFYRFSPKFMRTIELDETSDSTIVNMLWSTEMYMKTPWCAQWVETLVNHVL
ncbi:hypothetical protein L596_014561 [Steinernema carpocapsae]|uniref:phospholipase A2 n=1 Tax=Steinernema carpocapsae TaxID=34508 RepID=A0A4U5NCT5_STECR|nr:hypothetical protein L596_014561 [Steinernema carpocapsae]